MKVIGLSPVSSTLNGAAHPRIYVCPLTDKEIPRSVEAYRGMIKCLRWMDKIDVCVVRSSSRFYAAREPPL